MTEYNYYININNIYFEIYGEDDALVPESQEKFAVYKKKTNRGKLQLLNDFYWDNIFQVCRQEGFID